MEELKALALENRCTTDYLVGLVIQTLANPYFKSNKVLDLAESAAKIIFDESNELFDIQSKIYNAAN